MWSSFGLISKFWSIFIKQVLWTLKFIWIRWCLEEGLEPPLPARRNSVRAWGLLAWTRQCGDPNAHCSITLKIQAWGNSFRVQRFYVHHSKAAAKRPSQDRRGEMCPKLLQGEDRASVEVVWVSDWERASHCERTSAGAVCALRAGTVVCLQVLWQRRGCHSLTSGASEGDRGGSRFRRGLDQPQLRSFTKLRFCYFVKIELLLFN